MGASEVMKQSLSVVAQRENILNNLGTDMKWGKPPEFTLDS